MNLFPMFLKLEGRQCLVVGGGVIAESKIRSLLASGAAVRVVAPKARKPVVDWARAGVIAWEARAFETRDLDHTFLVIAATALRELNARIFREAQGRGILCNAVDDPRHCDFYFPAVVRRGDLQLAISTAGRSPALAQRLRRELESQFSPRYGGWLDELGKQRDHLLASTLDPERRRQILHGLASRNNFEKWQWQSNRSERPIHEG